MGMGTKKHKYATQVETSTMKTGGNQKRSGYHKTNTRSKRMKSLGKPVNDSIKKQPPPENKSEFDSMLAHFAAVSEKRHNTTDAMIRNQ